MFLSLLSCTVGYHSGPKANYAEAPLAQPFSSFPEDSESESIQKETSKLFIELVKLHDQEIFKPEFCLRVGTTYANEGRIPEVEKFAKKTTGSIAPLLKKTLKDVSKTYIEFDPFAQMVDTYLKDLNQNSTEGLLWLTTEALLQNMCGVSSKTQIYTFAAAMVHLYTSKEAIYKLYFDVYEPIFDFSPYNHFWFQQDAAIAKATKALSDLTLNAAKPSADAFVRASNASLTTSGGAIPISCSKDVFVGKQIAPNLRSAGTNINLDSQFWLRIDCKNTSSQKMLISESIFPSSTYPKCLADATAEIIFPELKPKSETSILMGPYLLTDECSSVQRSYSLKSTHYNGTLNLSVSIKPKDYGLVVNVPSEDRDSPGHSKSNKVPGLSEGEAVELMLSAKAGADYTLMLNEFESVPANGVSPFKLIEDAKGIFVYRNGVHKKEDDVDLVLHNSKAWSSSAKDRLSRMKDPTSTFDLDISNAWFKTSFLYLSSCKSSSSYLPSPLDNLYGQVCEEFSYEEFSNWMKTLYQNACKTRVSQMDPTSDQMLSDKLMPKKKEKGLQAQAQDEANQVMNAISHKMYIAPSPALVHSAVEILLKYKIISPSDLDTSLKYIDDMDYNHEKQPSFSREKARQIILAAVLAELTVDILGAEYLEEVSIFKDGAAVSILDLEQQLLRLMITKTLQQQSLVKESNDSKSLLERSLDMLIEEHKCSSADPLPPPPPHEIHIANRYFYLPFEK